MEMAPLGPKGQTTKPLCEEANLATKRAEREKREAIAEAGLHTKNARVLIVCQTWRRAYFVSPK